MAWIATEDGFGFIWIDFENNRRIVMDGVDYIAEEKVDGEWKEVGRYKTVDSAKDSFLN